MGHQLAVGQRGEGVGVMVGGEQKESVAAEGVAAELTRVTLVVVSAVQFLTPFMMSAVGVALPTIGREFAASAVQLGLAETVYVLALSIFLLPAGRLGDIHGRRKIFLSGVTLFFLATLLLSISWSMTVFLLFRFLQGCGAAMISGTSIAILAAVFPPATRGKAMGVIVGCVYMGLSTGPLLAGFMIHHWGWRAIFYVALGVEAIAWLMVVHRLRGEWAEARGERFDWQGGLIYAGAFFCLIYGILGRKAGSPSWLPALGLAGLLVFFRFEAGSSSPLLDVRLLLHNRVFAFSNLATMINYAASFGLTFFFSLYLQYVKGMTPQHTGLVLIVQPLLQAIFSPLCGRWADRYSPAIIATLGMAICALGLGLAAAVGSATPLALVLLMLAVMGIGFALFSSPNTTAVMGSVGPRHYGVASSLVATMRTSGMLASMTIVTVFFGHFLGDQPVGSATLTAFLHSMHLALSLFCALCVLGVLFSLVRVRPATGGLQGVKP